jgi:hypothetical protein
MASPPTSPRSPSANFNPYFGGIPGGAPPSSHHAHARRFSFGSDYSSEHDACDNCNFLVPKDLTERMADGAQGGSPGVGGRTPQQQQRGSPVMRTVQPVVARGFAADDDSEDDDDDSDDASDDSPTDGMEQLGSSPAAPRRRRRRRSSRASPTHVHKLTYVTRRHPESQTLYSRLRHSCIRALSCESLPGRSPSGPLLFGDHIAGYTIAYIFRLPDPRSRGNRRTYALTALCRDCRRAAAAFVPLTMAFESMKAKIVAMADRVIEREAAAAAEALRGGPPGATSASLPLRPAAAPVAPPSPVAGGASRSATGSPVGAGFPNPPPANAGGGGSAAATAAARAIPLADVSSFLAAKRVDPDGYPRLSRDAMRARGLGDIVGSDRFFVELHAQFCIILSGLTALGMR